jgi:hypothetical protein
MELTYSADLSRAQQDLVLQLERKNRLVCLLTQYA